MYKANDSSSELIDDGTYKATVESVEERPNYDHSDNQLVITWSLSNGRKFFDRVSKDKDKSGDYNHYKIGLILYALRMEEVDSTDDLIKKLIGLSCKMTITHLFSAQKNGDYNSVKSYDIDLEEEVNADKPAEPAKKEEPKQTAPEQSQAPASPVSQASQAKKDPRAKLRQGDIMDISDDDLPF
jgi:hypothetical protein